MELYRKRLFLYERGIKMRVKLVGLNEEMLEAVKGLEELIDF